MFLSYVEDGVIIDIVFVCVMFFVIQLVILKYSFFDYFYSVCSGVVYWWYYKGKGRREIEEEVRN